ncbi:glycosyltransferase family 2 protein [Fidelibacter multiformis]|uniref:glycosyltransferase family 2 protein n=1 Tax=Fidelibacter multiformis TaxID=3377529 RepID=UPI0037DD1B9C
MYKSNSIAVVIPCYNEAKQISRVIKTIPNYIDHVVVVDDFSKDNTIEKITSIHDHRIILIEHKKNLGVGAAISTGYKWVCNHDVDIAVVMAGDGQMDPDDLPALLDPVCDGTADYSKGNRLFTGEAYKMIPKIRFWGNAFLSFLTKIASGYWHVADSQSGYIAINKKALHAIDWDKMYKRYGQPNDLLVRLNIHNMRVVDVPVKPVYNVGETSGLKIRKIIFTIPFMLIRMFFTRLFKKYMIRNFHPLVLFYFMGILLNILSIPLLVRFVYYWITAGTIPKVNFLAWMMLTILGVQFLLFAMWFDMEENRHLEPDILDKT